MPQRCRCHRDDGSRPTWGKSAHAGRWEARKSYKAWRSAMRPFKTWRVGMLRIGRKVLASDARYNGSRSFWTGSTPRRKISWNPQHWKSNLSSKKSFFRDELLKLRGLYLFFLVFFLDVRIMMIWCVKEAIGDVLMSHIFLLHVYGAFAT